MKHDRTSRNGSFTRALGSSNRRVAMIALISCAGALAGCDVQSYLDPSVAGRWQVTPTKTPILETLGGTLEGAKNSGVETSQVRAEDLIAEPEAYRVGSGDAMDVIIEDFLRDGQPSRFDAVEIDARGYIDLPQVPPVYVYGQTVDQIKASITKALSDAGILKNPILSVVIRQRRKLTYTVMGNVNAPGLYSITKPDFRLMDALSQSGRFSESVDKVYVIRQIPLSDRLNGRPTQANNPSNVNGGPTPPTPPSVGPDGKKPSVIDVIDDLSKPDGMKISPGVMGMQPAADEPKVPAKKPVIDLLDQPGAREATASNPPAAPTTGTTPTVSNESTWVFVNGQWIQAAGSRPSVPMGTATPTSASSATNPASPMSNASGPGLPAAPAGSQPAQAENPPSELVTQRVIEIPMAPLMAGSAQFNIIIRPGDIVRVPTQNEGVFYMAGQVARPGPYTLPLNGKMTLLRAVVAAGGLANTAIPERVDLTRMVGPDRQITVRVNLRAIEEGQHPDIFIKADDRVNVGSNIFAFPLAVFRNGLRASYGFGFILDRNFGYEVFGPQNTGSNGGF